jgi:hypothetical protein
MPGSASELALPEADAQPALPALRGTARDLLSAAQSDSLPIRATTAQVHLARRQ